MTYQFYKQADGIIIAFDITNKVSYQNVTVWIQSIYQHSNPNISKVLVGNKLDLADDFRAVKKTTAEALAKDNDMEYFETSAYKDENIKDMFHHIMTKVFDLKFAQKMLNQPEDRVDITKPRKSEMHQSNSGDGCKC